MTDKVTSRRRAEVKLLRLGTLLTDSPTPWRRGALPEQLAAMGFRPIEDPRTSQRELAALDAFLGLWLELMPITAGIRWLDSESAE